MPSLIITVDTELSNFPDGQGLWGRSAEGNELGLSFILDLLESSDSQATFFVDVYGNPSDDVAQQRRACEQIVDLRQDLQLHTHPAPSFDRARPQLSDYSLAEQVQILEFGCERIRDWTGRQPAVHRAGDWAANDDSLTALSNTDFVADFSACAWSRFCQLPNELLAGNGRLRHHGILCCPATCFRDRLRRRLRRLDLHGCSGCEIGELVARPIDPLIITLHSFSFFLEYRRGVDLDTLRMRFRRFLETVREAGYHVETASAATQRMRTTPDREDALTPFPVTSVTTSVCSNVRSTWRRFTREKSRKVPV